MDWNDQCPERGAALTHAHWKDCNPGAGGHPEDGGPNVGHVHDWATCCHCEQRIRGTQDPASTRSDQNEKPDPTADHKYVPTMVGRCLRCQLPLVAHPVYLDPPEAEAQADANGLPIKCDLRHDSITPKLLIGDEGWVWTSCPKCGVVLEPAMAKQEYPRKWGPGRGNLSPREAQKALARVGWRAWLALHGGGEGAPPSDT